MRENAKKNIINYLILIILVLFITDSPVFQINDNPIFNRISQVVLILSSIFVVLLYLIKRKIIKFGSKTQNLFVIIISLVLTWLFNFELKLVVPIKILLLLSSYFLLKL